MKMNMAIALAALALTAGEFKSETDRFTGATKHVASFNIQIKATGVTSAQGSALTITGVPGGFPVVLFGINVTSDDWRYLRCKSVYVLHDGQPLELSKKPGVGGDVIYGGVFESVTIQLDSGMMDKISRSKKIEIKVCNDVFEVSGNALSDVKKVIAASVGEYGEKKPAEDNKPKVLTLEKALEALTCLAAAKEDKELSAKCGYKFDGRSIIQLE
jgi:hypothetical protein